MTAFQHPDNHPQHPNNQQEHSTSYVSTIQNSLVTTFQHPSKHLQHPNNPLATNKNTLLTMYQQYKTAK